MGLYVIGGKNEIGIAATENWAAIWTVDAPYIHVLTRSFFDKHEQEIREAAVRGKHLPDSEGQTGSVHEINTNGDLDDDGMPKDGRTPDEYVKDELEVFSREWGDDYLSAIEGGYPG